MPKSDPVVPLYPSAPSGPPLPLGEGRVRATFPEIPYGEIRPRERVYAALAHQETDRVPADLWAVPEVWRRLTGLYGVSQQEILRRFRIDMRWVVPKYIAPEVELPGGVRRDHYGALRRDVIHNFGSYSEYASFPLDFARTAQDVYDWDWPRPESWAPANIPTELAELDREDEYFVCYDLGGIFERSWGLLGFERFLADLAENPEVPMAIMERMTDLYIENFKRTVEAGGGRIDLVYTWDDIAHQRGLLLSPAMWRRTIVPHHQRLKKVIQSYGIKHMYHSCGSVYSLIPEMITELGFDILNPLQPAAKNMDLALIKERFGRDICFHGGLDIQNTLPNGNPEDVRAEVRSRCTVMGRGGGYILAPSHYIQNDTPTHNIQAMYTTDRKSR